MPSSSGIAMTPPIARRVRAYFAPVDRINSSPTVFDPAQQGNFNLDAPPTPWIDLGWLGSFERRVGSKIAALRSGAPGLPQVQVRTEIDVLVSVSFLNWGKLQMAVTSGSEQMNLLSTTAGAAPNGSGGPASPAVPIGTGSTATFVALSSSQLEQFSSGQMVAVDLDYTGQTGYVGSGISGAYVSSSNASHLGTDYIRRISFNVGRVTSVSSVGLELAQPLIAGVPTAGMSVQRVLGFVDREGSNFFQEWSGLFVYPGEQGDRILIHFPRLQIASGSAETRAEIGIGGMGGGTLEQVLQAAEFRALPVTDSNDDAQAVCFRSYLPAAATKVW
jgi:hypothetical protein